jgi:hypothetical protein
LSIAQTAAWHILELTGSARRAANFPAGTT